MNLERIEETPIRWLLSDDLQPGMQAAIAEAAGRRLECISAALERSGGILPASKLEGYLERLLEYAQDSLIR